MSLTLTPTEQRIYDVLSDGMPHTKDELMGCLSDELAGSNGAVAIHINHIRAKLKGGRSLDIVSYQRQFAYYYRLVALINQQDDG